MAHGLLEGKQEPEHLGKQYINEFLSRGFFQDFYPDPIWLGSFKMHDLVGDLARSLSKDEFPNEDAKHKNVWENGRHVWFHDGRKQENLVNSNNDARSVIVPNSSTIAISEAFLSRCNKLRFLWLGNIEELPECAGSLKYLRCLMLEGFKGLKKLPNSIHELHYLQTLSLLDCEKFEELPENIGQLENLRWLGITTKQKRLSENGIETLTSLQFLCFSNCPNLETLFEGTHIQLESLRTLLVYECKSLKSLGQLSLKLTVLNSLEQLGIRQCRNLGALPEWLPARPSEHSNS